MKFVVILLPLILGLPLELRGLKTRTMSAAGRCSI
jgi:hypothetical protein